VAPGTEKLMLLRPWSAAEKVNGRLVTAGLSAVSVATQVAGVLLPSTRATVTGIAPLEA